jgi:hypothetical protein
MLILGLLGMYFDAVVVEVKTFLLLFRLALAILWQGDIFMEQKMWFGLVGNTEKKKFGLIMSNFWGRFFHVFRGKKKCLTFLKKDCSVCTKKLHKIFYKRGSLLGNEEIDFWGDSQVFDFFPYEMKKIKVVKWAQSLWGFRKS